VKKTLSRADRERWCLLGVERAQPDEIPAGLLELYVATDELNDVRALANNLDRFLSGARRHESSG
jgi:hypothetical protein